jgi:hypothetical protein
MGDDALFTIHRSRGRGGAKWSKRIIGNCLFLQVLALKRRVRDVLLQSGAIRALSTRCTIGIA